jgi:uncharacterized membrane protein AbrB (regulator of aidB expression)
MKRLLTLLAVMVMGAVGVRTQQPSPYLTGPFVNGVMWREYSETKKVSFVIGAVDGFNAGVCLEDGHISAI